MWWAIHPLRMKVMSERTCYDDIIDECTELIGRFPTFAAAYFEQGLAYMQMLEYKNAEGCFRKCIELNFPSVRHYRLLVQCLREQHHIREALEILQITIAKYGNRCNQSLHMVAGKMYMDILQWAKAMEHYKIVIAQCDASTVYDTGRYIAAHRRINECEFKLAKTIDDLEECCQHTLTTLALFRRSFPNSDDDDDDDLQAIQKLVQDIVKEIESRKQTERATFEFQLENIPISTWTCEQVCRWIKSLGMDFDTLRQLAVRMNLTGSFLVDHPDCFDSACSSEIMKQRIHHDIEKLKAIKLNKIDSILCSVCQIADRCMVFEPCHHFGCCHACSVQVQTNTGQCPYCRTAIHKCIKIFWT